MIRGFKTNAAVYQGRLLKGEDLLKGLTSVIKEKNIASGCILGMGAVSCARLAYFNQQTKTFEEIFLPEGLEILSLKGNISKKDGESFAHIHVVLSGRDFKAIGGHLLNDTIVYAFEYEIFPFDGQPLIRKFDEDTGLSIWQ